MYGSHGENIAVAHARSLRLVAHQHRGKNRRALPLVVSPPLARCGGLGNAARARLCGDRRDLAPVWACGGPGGPPTARASSLLTVTYRGLSLPAARRACPRAYMRAHARTC